MEKGRLEAFSDGVIAIIITIMVLEMKVPKGSDIEALVLVAAPFLSYLLSFIYVGIYWNNHHHMLHASKNISGRVLWANLHLLFWLSLFPFTTAWMGENHFAIWPTAVYGFVLLMAAIAYVILQTTLIRCNPPDSLLKRATQRDWKGKISPILYVLGIASAFIFTWIAQLFFVAVAIIWLVPDSRIEKLFNEQ